jgi:hypothetical protein
MMKYDILRKNCNVASAMLICVLAAGALLCGCSKPPSYTITVRNEGTRPINGELIVSEKFGFKVTKLMPGTESKPLECNAELAETAKWTLFVKGGTPMEQKIQLKSAVDQKMTQADIVVAIGADGKATVSATPKD